MLLIQWSIGKGMIEYVNSKESEALKPVIVQLKTEYKKNNNWSTMQDRSKKFADLLFSKLKDSEFIMTPPLPPQFDDSKPPRRDPPADFFNDAKQPEGDLANRRPIRPRFREQINYVLFDATDNIVVGGQIREPDYNKAEIIIDHVKVGWLAVPKHKKIIDGYELEFIQQQQSYLWIIALVTMFLVALITLFLARHLAEPIKLVMSGMHKLTQGDYNQKIDIQRKDELGELSRDFNELAVTLGENDSARKRWLANISHELRTPIAILRGELEAMLDEVRPLNKENIGSANDEVKHLQHLVNDLQQLTSADVGGMHYRKKVNDLTKWLSKEVDKYRSYLAAADVSLIVEIEANQANIFSDSTRLCQLFENLINNCIKYAEASVVKISLVLDKDETGKLVRVVVEDNGVGVSDMHLPHLFEHLYRVDNSRNRKTGGSGLGLSICAHIVAAHQGSISAEHSDLGGLAITIEFPLSK
ncbi:ATP-binding protein [Psychromonas algicola]|uniref:ATP-binding protein n=1 Tax=Psychromonas algicola TaxID=2555642 RepID=UPI001FBB38D3|nr:ATP-binding protein [Psychromonas sp. RZ5]